MRRFIEEADRGQWTLLPECLNDFMDESNPVRVIDALSVRSITQAAFSPDSNMSDLDGRQDWCRKNTRRRKCTVAPGCRWWAREVAVRGNLAFAHAPLRGA